MLCASIILPITPPELFAAAISTGLKPSLLRGDRLQAAEQHVRRRVASRERDAEPAEHRREERIEHAGVREREAEDRVFARVARRVAEREHRRDRQQRRPDHDERRQVRA